MRLKLLLLLLLSVATAQYQQPNRLKFGGSLGFGGTYMYGKFSFDVGYHTTKLHVAPGLWYLSAGITQELFTFKTWRGRKMSAIAQGAYHDDWLLTSINRSLKENNQTRDLDLYNLLAGIHIDLRPQGIIYLEASGGFLYVVEKFNTVDGQTLPPANKQYFYPMLQLRIGAWIRRKPLNGIGM